MRPHAQNAPERNRRRNRYLSLLLALALFASLTACGGPSSNDGADEKIINVAFTTAWGSFNPYYSNASTMYEMSLYDKIYDKLAFTDLAGTVILPRAADSWESADDGLSIIFHLNPEASWSDGVKATAHDWEFTARLLADPRSAFSTRVFTQALSGTDGVGAMIDAESFGASAIDDATFKLTFKNPFSPEDFILNYNRQFLVLPEHLLKNVSPANILDAEFWRNPIGSGPCVYASQVMGAEMTLLPNPYYHLKGANWDKLLLRVVDSPTRIGALLSGDVDHIVLGNSISPEDKPIAESNGLIVRDAEVRNFFMEVLINEHNIPDERIRQALHYAVNKRAIVDASSKDIGDPVYSYEMPTSDYYDPSLEFTPDVDKAKALLREAGYDGETYTFAFAAKRESLAALLAQQWTQAGINIKMETVDVATMFSGLQNGVYDLGLSGHSPSAYALWFEAEFPANNHSKDYVPDPTRQDYVSRIQAEMDRDAKIALVKEYQQYLAEKTWFIPIFLSGEYWVESQRVSGIRNAASLMCNDNVWEWRVN